MAEGNNGRVTNRVFSVSTTFAMPVETMLAIDGLRADIARACGRFPRRAELLRLIIDRGLQAMAEEARGSSDSARERRRAP